MNHLLGMPEAASAHAADIDYTMFLIHALMLTLFVGWGLYFLFALFRFRASRHPRADHRGVRTHASNYVEAGVALAEAVLLIGFSVPLWADRVAEFPSEENAVTVRVIGEQFAWNIHYPGADGIFGRTDPQLVDTSNNPIGLDSKDPYATDDIVTLNQLHLPVNKPALIYLFSKDVIHSFSLVEMRVKQDAIPGLSIPTWFVPTVTTDEMRAIKGNPDYNYEISCAQLCGLGHYRMKGLMTIHSAEGFDAWMAEEARKAAESGSGDIWDQ